MTMRLTREKVEQLSATFRDNPELEVVDIENTADGKLRAYRVEVVESRKPLRLGQRTPDRPQAVADKV